MSDGRSGAQIGPDEHICGLVLELAAAFRDAGQVELSQELERVVKRGPDAVWAHVRSREVWGGQGGILDFVPVDASRGAKKRVFGAIVELGEYQNSIGRGGARVSQLVASARSRLRWWSGWYEYACAFLWFTRWVWLVLGFLLVRQCLRGTE